MADSYVDPTAMSPIPGTPNYQWNLAQYAAANPNLAPSTSSLQPTSQNGTTQMTWSNIPNPNYISGSTAPTNNTIQQQPSGDVLGANTGPTEPGLDEQLNAIFNPQLETLGAQEGAVGTQYGNAVTDINAQAGLSTANLTQQKNEGMQGLATTEKQAGTRKEDALTSATRLYNELQRGGQQRFGGASSAGEAYQSLTAVEQQRRQGSIQTAYETAMQQVAGLKSNLQQKFLLATKELEMEKNRALDDAKMSFDEGIRQIQAAKNQLASDRATASLNMLQDLRNKVYAINLQSLQFSQQLALNNQLSTQKVDQATQYFVQQLGVGQTGVNQFGTQAMNTAGTTSLGISSPNALGTLAQTGQIKKREELT